MSEPHTSNQGHRDKRRKLDQAADSDTPWDPDSHIRACKRLTYDTYTVAWICALPLELVAARSMLDEEHEKLDLPLTDLNAYYLGSIGPHNVVLCCLPFGEYGTTSATKVASTLIQTFPNSKLIPLLVGIGGGVPSMDHDIRLGDIVVGVSNSGGPAVKQYDYGKTIANGVSETQGSLNKTAPILSRAIAGFISEHKLGRNRISKFMAEATHKHSLEGYEYPSTELNVAPEYHCVQYVEGSKCGTCGLTKTTSTTIRTSTDPVIHYGIIGSGNQVVKDSCTRDRLARQHDLICFEMEAAGLMDDMHCLVIRGISDYCDAQKTKVFQNYSALAAAAYAKDLLLAIPPRHDELTVNAPEAVHQDIHEHRKKMMEALDFDEAESRRATIKSAHAQTCKWFLTQQEYLDWSDGEKLPQHNGLLWFRGKAGCGKSTLMKFLVNNMERIERQKLSNIIVISFFCNARGSELERSTIGMYRSLLHQLLKKIPKFQYLLDKRSRLSSFNSLDTLRHLLEMALRDLQDLSVFCFVDALDECPEDQIQDMVTFFESLGESAVQNKSRWHVCFSSRYYPNISTRVGIPLELDRRDEHANDIKKYINAELKAGTGSSAAVLKAEIAEKSGGIFLWIVLVVRMLKKLFDRGRGNRITEMRNKLKEIPLELDELFHDILTRDNNNMAELVLTIQWLLYSQRPLKREEIYFAIQSGNDDTELECWNTEEVSISDMDKYILDSSKGLVELTRSKSPSVQFIHESVREFLLKPESLRNLWPESGAISEGKSHHRLFRCCWRYMTFGDTDKLDLPESSPTDESSAKFRQETLKKFPFLEYATRNLLYHADHTVKVRLLDPSFLHNLDVKRYISLQNALTQHMTGQLKQTTLFLLLIKKCYYSLLSSWIHLSPPDANDLYKVIHKAAKSGDEELYRKILSGHRGRSAGDLELVLFELLGQYNIGSCGCYNKSHDKISNPEEIAQFLLDPLLPLVETSEQAFLNRNLCLAALLKYENGVKYLLAAGAQPNSIEGSALQFAATDCRSVKSIRHWNEDPHYFVQVVSLIRELIRYGAKLVDSQEAIVDCAKWADTQVAGIIWDAASTDPTYTSNTSGLFITAAYHGNVRILPFLVEKGFKIDAIVLQEGSINCNPLQYAISWGTTRFVEWLVQHGAIDTHLDESPLCYAIRNYGCGWRGEKREIVRVLLTNQSLVNQADEDGQTPLLLTVDVKRNNLDLARILLEHGADPNQADKDGLTALHKAIWKAEKDMTKLLLEHGADPNLADSSGQTALHSSIWQESMYMTKLLLEHGADPNQADKDGLTALHIAIWKEGKDMTELLEYSVDFNQADSSGWIVSHETVWQKRKDMIELLLKYSADPNQADLFGQTALHKAIWKEEKAMIKLLLDHGSDTNKLNSSRPVLLHYAIKQQDYVRAKRLLN